MHFSLGQFSGTEGVEGVSGALKCCVLCVQVYAVVDEMFLAGEIRETSQQKVLNQLQYLNTLD